jgi:hypothetical protein
VDDCVVCCPGNMFIKPKRKRICLWTDSITSHGRDDQDPCVGAVARSIVPVLRRVLQLYRRLCRQRQRWNFISLEGGH